MTTMLAQWICAISARVAATQRIVVMITTLAPPMAATLTRDVLIRSSPIVNRVFKIQNVQITTLATDSKPVRRAVSVRREHRRPSMTIILARTMCVVPIIFARIRFTIAPTEMLVR